MRKNEKAEKLLNAARTEQLLKAARDHIDSTLEQPANMRAWDHLLVYCPREVIQGHLKSWIGKIAAAKYAGLEQSENDRRIVHDLMSKLAFPQISITAGGHRLFKLPSSISIEERDIIIRALKHWLDN